MTLLGEDTYRRLFPRLPLHAAVYAAALNAGAALQFAGGIFVDALVVAGAAAALAALAPLALALWAWTSAHSSWVRAAVASLVVLLCGLFLAYYVFNMFASADGGNPDTAGQMSIFLFPVFSLVLVMLAFLLVEIPSILSAAFRWMQRRLNG